MKKKNFRTIFFNENEYTFSYLKSYIKTKKIKSDILVLTIESINNPFSETIQLRSNFFLKIFFLTINAKYVYSTSTNLNNSIFLRSKVSKTKYIYLQHSPVSLSMIYDEKAFINFDVIQAINKSQYIEVQEINNIFNKKIKPFKSKYRFFTEQFKYQNQNSVDVLIAPTWHTNFYKLNIHEKLFKIFNEKKISFEFRPHPMSLKRKEFKNIGENIKINQDKILNLKKYKFIISDWSGIFLEFSIINKSKPILVNTDKKILNNNYLKFKNLPIEVETRKIIGVEFEVDNIEGIIKYILNENKNNSHNEIEKFYQDNFY